MKSIHFPLWWNSEFSSSTCFHFISTVWLQLLVFTLPHDNAFEALFSCMTLEFHRDEVSEYFTTTSSYWGWVLLHPRQLWHFWQQHLEKYDTVLLIMWNITVSCFRQMMSYCHQFFLAPISGLTFILYVLIIIGT